MENSVKMKIQGIVASDKNDKTIIVSARVIKPHKKYRKMVSFDRKYAAHDSENKCKAGDRVVIEESAPISKHKKWKVIKIVSSGTL